MPSQTQGIDGFLYTVNIDGKTANYHFWDQNDIKNSQDVSISDKEFPEGVTNPDTREAVDYAYSIVSEKLTLVQSDKVKADAVRAAELKQDADTQARLSAQEFHANAVDGTVRPNATEKRADGVTQNVYNTASADTASTESTDKKK